MSYIDKLFEIIEQSCGVTRSDIEGKSRKRSVVVCRKIIGYLLRQKGYTLLYIGKILNRHHSSIVYYADQKRMECELKSDPIMYDFYNIIIDKINESKQVSE
jgi:chromosomal replication initiation ATPase DnaA